MGACVYLRHRAKDPTTGEAIACLEAIRFVTDLGFSRAYVEEDVLTIIKRILLEVPNRFEICIIVNEIRNQS